MTPSTIASATATVFTCTSMLFTSFMASPLPSGPTWKVWLPITSNRSLHFATTAASPPTITDSSPDCARPVPPLTGASIMAMFFLASILGQCARRERIDGRHADHDVARLGALGDAADHRLCLLGGLDDQDGALDLGRDLLRRACDLGVQPRRLRGIDVVHHQGRAGTDEVAGHGTAHGAQADETDLAGHLSLPWVMVGL